MVLECLFGNYLQSLHYILLSNVSEYIRMWILESGFKSQSHNLLFEQIEWLYLSVPYFFFPHLFEKGEMKTRGVNNKGNYLLECCEDKIS